MIEYKCEKCKSVWNTDKSVNNCPFCGNAIRDINHKTNPIEKMDSLLLTIKQELGQEAFSQENYKKEHVIAYMLDYAPHLKKQIELFEIALKANVYNDFSIAIQSNPINTMKIKYKLANNYFLNDSSIDAIVGWFSTIFEIKTTNVSESTKQNNQTNITQKNALTNTKNKPKNLDDNANRKSNNTETTYSVSFDYSMFAKTNQTILPDKAASKVNEKKAIKQQIKQTDSQKNKITKEKIRNMTTTTMDDAFLSSNIPSIKALAEIGDIDGEFFLGRCYHFGLGVDKNIEKSIKWYEKAILHQHPMAMNNLGAIYLDSDTTRASFYFNQALENGFVMAAHNIILVFLMHNSIDILSNIDIIDGFVLKGIDHSTPNKYQSEKETICWKYIFSVIGFFNALQAIEIIKNNRFIKKTINKQEKKAMKSKYISLNNKYEKNIEKISQIYEQKYDERIDDDVFVIEKCGNVLDEYPVFNKQ